MEHPNSRKTPKQRKAKAASQRPNSKAQSSFSQTEYAPVAKAEKFKNRNPKIEFKTDGSTCRVRHTERIGTLNGSVAFTATAYAINPGLPSTFPYLSAIANRFESYRFEKLEFHFKTKTATTALGDVIQVIDYDASDGAPESSIQAESYQGAVSAAPWQDTCNKSSLQNLHKLPSRYVRGEAAPANTDIKLYDVGNYYICTENQASTALVGYLYVSYDVYFMTPQLRASDFGISGGTIDGATAMSGANPFGTAPVADSQSRGIAMSAASVLTVSSPGTYVLTWQVTGTTVTALNATAGSNGTLTALTTEMSNAAGTIRVVTVSLLSTAPNVTVTFSATAASVTASSLDVGSAPASSFALAALARGNSLKGLGCSEHRAVLLSLPNEKRSTLMSLCPQCRGQ